MFRTFLATVIILLCSAVILSAQASMPDSALQSILATHRGTPLSLDEAVQHALKNATSVKTAEAAYLAALGTRRREAGQFDPSFYFNYMYNSQDAPTASFFAGAEVLFTTQSNLSTGFRMNLPIGTQLDLSLNATRLNTNSSFAFLNPEYNTFGSLSFRQPILLGFTASSREALSVSEKLLEAQKKRYDQQVLAVNADVEMAYWDLYAVERNYAVLQLTRDQAAELLREAELRATSGLVGPNQVANARTFLAQQELLLLEGEELYAIRSDALASLIGVRPSSDEGKYVPRDVPPNDFLIEDEEYLVELAIKNNLDLQAVQNNIEGARIQETAAKWRALPSLDIVGGIGGSGLTGTPHDIIFGGDTLRATRSGSFSDALSQLGKRNYPNWNIGVEFNLPIGLRSGLGERDRLKAEVINAEQLYTELTRTLADQVRRYWRELSNGKKRINAATKGVEAAQEQVRIGTIEFHNGRTTAFELVRLGADLASAQQRYSEALVRTAKAAAILRQLTSGKYLINQKG